MDSRIKLRHVQCFLEIARRRSLARAAEALSLSQPAVTKTLQELETILGAPLIERSRKGAGLTTYGEIFLPRASASMLELERAVQSVGQVRMRSERAVRVGALPTVAAQVMPAAVGRFMRGGAEAGVSLVTGPNRHLLDLLRADRLDLVVGRLGAPEAMADLSFIHLYSEPVRLVVRPGHPLLDRKPPALDRLASFPVILPDPEAVIRPAVDRLLITLGVGELPTRIEAVSPSFGRAFTADSDAVWIISHGVVSRDLKQGRLALLAVDTSDTSGPVGLTTRADAQPTLGAKMFENAVRWAIQRL